MSKVKPIGPIPDGYESRDGELVIDGKKSSALVAEHGSPLFVYSKPLLSARIEALREAMPSQLHIHYAMKANPYAPVAFAYGRAR